MKPLKLRASSPMSVQVARSDMRKTAKVAKQRAAQIITATNSHDALVSALTSLVEWLDISGLTSTKDDARNALKLAEGEGER